MAGDANETAGAAGPRQSARLGTFAGVFTPSILTILGLILFLRLGYVVGSVGFLDALTVICMANAISLLTTFSVSAIATAMKVKGGGDYYVISRTLGVGLGSAIGTVLFLAQAVSVGFYCIGFAEVLAPMLFGDSGWAMRGAAGGAALLLFVLAWLGSDWATKFQYVVMALLVAALGSFFWGTFDSWNPVWFSANWEIGDDIGLFAAFAIFFPAVTGFTQGISMSGDLRDPGRSIPRGTFAAVLLSFVVYLLCAFLLAGASLGKDLLDSHVMAEVSAFAPLIQAGIVAATLSSALASFLGAPRILQALAADGVLPFLTPFAKGEGPANNPRRAVLLTAAIALAVVALGDLNLVAVVVTMFFLISYGLLNYATYFEARAASPAFRPTLKLYHPWISLLGFLGCLGCILAIDATAGAVAVALVMGIQWLVTRRGLPARWSDSSRAHDLKRAREHLLTAAREAEHPRDWRPQLLVFSDDSERRTGLVRFAAWIEGGSGLSTVVRILEGEGAAKLKEREEALAALREELAESEAAAFPMVVLAPDIDAAVSTLVQSVGSGPLRVNTVVVNWHKEAPAYLGGLADGHYAENLRAAFRLGANLVVLDFTAEEWRRMEAHEPKQQRLDLWWSDSATSRLMLILAYLAQRHSDWQGATLRLLATADSEEAAAQRREDIEARLAEVRIPAEVEVLPEAGLPGLIAASADADMVFLPFQLHRGQFRHPWGTPLAEILPQLPICALCLAAEDVSLDPDPDEPAEEGGEESEEHAEGEAEAEREEGSE